MPMGRISCTLTSIKMNDAGMLFMRVAWSLHGFDLEPPAFRPEFDPIAGEFHMRWRLEWSCARPPIAIFVRAISIGIAISYAV